MAEDIDEILEQIDEDSMQQYQEFFDRFDMDKKGYIMAIQVGSVMDAMEQEYDEKTLRKTIKKFDADGSGKLEFEEFAAMVYTVANTVDKETMEKELREAFRLFDKTQLGYLSRDIMKGLLKEIDDKLTEQELDDAIDEIDEDGSGKIEFEGNSILRFPRNIPSIEFYELMAGE